MFLNFEDSLKMSSTDLGLESLSRRNRFLFSTSFISGCVVVGSLMNKTGLMYVL